MKAESKSGRRLLIAGGGVAAFQVATRIRGLDSKMEVVMCTSEGEPPVSSCGIPWGICDVYPLDSVILKNADWFAENGIDLRLNTTVDSVDAEKGEALISGPGGAGKENFDFLVIATGRTPFVPPIPGNDLPGVFTLSVLDDARRIRAALKEAKKVTIAGAGPIGLELACSLSDCGYEVSVAEAKPSILPGSLDPDLARHVQQHLSGKLERLEVGAMMDAIEGEKRVESVSVAGKKWTADVVVLSTGMRPNTALGKASGLDIGPSGGLATDNRLHCVTGGKPLLNIYTLGDCAEIRDGVTGQPRLSQLASTTLLESRVVCANLSGGSAMLSGVVSPQVTALPGFNAASVGLTSAHAENAGIDFTESTGQAKSRAGYYPGAGTCTAKLLFEQDSLIGAQLVSPGEVHGTLDMLVQIILHKGGAEEILSMERTFSPPLSMLEDAVAKAAARKPRNQ